MTFEQINNEGKALYLHHDKQGSTRMLTGSTGTGEGAYTYDAYGNTTGHTGTATTSLQYDGQYTNGGGLIYMRARAYDPATAQFMTTDPMGPLTRAPYNYAHDNPLNESDPAGLCSINPFSSSGCLSEGVEAGVHFAEEHPVATGIALGVVAVATGGAAIAVEGGVATSVLLTSTSAAAGLGASALDTARCLNGDAGACAGMGLGLASLGLSGPEFLASRELIEDASLYRGLAGAGLVFGGYGTLTDLLSGDPYFLSPLFGC
jgi:RHS repeat-associated protein